MSFRFGPLCLLAILQISLCVRAGEVNPGLEGEATSAGTGEHITPCRVDPVTSEIACAELESAEADNELSAEQLIKNPSEIPPEPELSERTQAIRDAAHNPFSLVSHKPNYLLPIAYNTSSDNPDAQGAGESEQFSDPEQFELQFQLSVQVPVWSGIFNDTSFLSLAYTNRSFWRAYNRSAPFRETNHEPELILTWLNDWEFLGFQNTVAQVAISHQSNGRGGEYSRGWNRIYANFIFERNNYFLSLKPWYRLPEDDVGNDNPDIDDYLGNFELTFGYQKGGYGFSTLLRNNLNSDNRGAIDLRWSFPLKSRVRGFVKYFNGYGESLIDYNERVQTFGVGVELAQGF